MSFAILSSSCFSLRNSELSSPPPTIYPLLIKPHFHHFENSHSLPLFPDYSSLFVNPNKFSYSMSTGVKDALSCRGLAVVPLFPARIPATKAGTNSPAQMKGRRMKILMMKSMMK
ncbi:unnamed protein product [Cuscuta epithymum]|uniref:Uncharacterized protein n=1 Tax=Cuscuta epithymum TaxID=186058 RepID=A0AAV0G5B6_9ASTE|nr:unnamed protein product [Cuscuta epithymum]